MQLDWSEGDDGSINLIPQQTGQACAAVVSLDQQQEAGPSRPEKQLSGESEQQVAEACAYTPPTSAQPAVETPQVCPSFFLRHDYQF